MKHLNDLIKGAAKTHGHLCPGQVVGVRMAMEGCRLIGLDNPRSLPQIKKLIVYIEMDRCATDAISYVTGVSLGRRSLKFIDNGIMAATFLNTQTQKAFRLVSTESSRTAAHTWAPEISDLHQRQVEAYKRMPINDLFTIQEVTVRLDACDMPGPTQFKATCQQCGQLVRDKKEVLKNDQVLCRNCAGSRYFEPVPAWENHRAG